MSFVYGRRSLSSHFAQVFHGVSHASKNVHDREGLRAVQPFFRGGNRIAVFNSAGARRFEGKVPGSRMSAGKKVAACLSATIQFLAFIASSVTVLILCFAQIQCRIQI